MKKRFFVISFLAISIALWAQTGTSASTVFDLDQVYLNLSDGTELLICQYIPIQSFDKKIAAEICILQSDTGAKTYLLRLMGSYYNSPYSKGDVIKSITEKEIASAIKALNYMIDKNKQITGSIPYTKMNFKAENGDVSFGFYIADSRKAFFEIGQIGLEFSAFYSIEMLQDIKSFFEMAQQKIASLK